MHWLTTAASGLVLLLGGFLFTGGHHHHPHPQPTPTPHPTASPMPTPIPTASPTARPTSTPTPLPTQSPTPQPTSTPTTQPSPVPTLSPTPSPTPSPTASPTVAPSVTPSPIPSPQPTSTNWSAPNDYPPYSWTPYAPSPNSVWNTPISQSPAVPDPNGSTYTLTYTNNGYNWFTQALTFGYANQSNQYQHPIYFGYQSDPLYKISCQASWAKATCPTTSFHIPKYAVPAGGSDAHLGVIDYTYNPPQELDMWATPLLSGSGGTASPQSAVSDPLMGDGLNVSKGVGAVGAGYNLWAGVIRAQEMAAMTASNYDTIHHALFMVTPCSSNNSVYPSISRSSDAFCSGGAPYGARLRLNMTPAQIAALSVPFYHKGLLLAASVYGVYQGDNNNTGLNFQTEADPMYTAAGTPNPLVAWAKANGVPFNGASYQIDISKDVPNTAWQWLLPPTNQP